MRFDLLVSSAKLHPLLVDRLVENGSGSVDTEPLPFGSFDYSAISASFL